MDKHGTWEFNIEKARRNLYYEHQNQLDLGPQVTLNKQYKQANNKILL